MIFSCTLDKELAWLHHRDLNALKAWAGKPETPEGWNAQWSNYKQKNRGCWDGWERKTINRKLLGQESP